jgi:phenylacetate-CoA ligase
MQGHQDTLWCEEAAPRLFALLQWSHAHVPAYNHIAVPREGKTMDHVLAALDALPIVTRQELTDEPATYMSNVLPHSVHWNSTGGSSGVPLRVLQDGRYRSASMAGSYLFYYWAGWTPTDRILKIWGSYTEAMGEHPALKRRVSSWLYDMPQLDAFALRSGDVRRYVKAIEELRPTIIESYVDAAELLSTGINASGVPLRHVPRGVIVSAGTLFPEWRQDIATAFQCPVYNRYGCREAGGIACSRSDDSLMVNPFTHIVEVVDADGKRISRGTGRILVTILNNSSMPLLRYDIGDFATVDSRRLYPDHGWQQIGSVDGRAMTMFRGPAGQYFSPELFVHTIGVMHNAGFLRQYQVIQEGLQLYTVLLVLRDGYSAGDSVVTSGVNGFMHDLRKVLGTDVTVNVKFVDSIEGLPSGKVPVCISKVTG